MEGAASDEIEIKNEPKMGEDDTTMEYDTEKIFKHLLSFVLYAYAHPFLPDQLIEIIHSFPFFNNIYVRLDASTSTRPPMPNGTAWT